MLQQARKIKQLLHRAVRGAERRNAAQRRPNPVQQRRPPQPLTQLRQPKVILLRHTSDHDFALRWSESYILLLNAVMSYDLMVTVSGIPARRETVNALS